MTRTGTGWKLPSGFGPSRWDANDVTSGLRTRVLAPLAVALLVLVTLVAALMFTARAKHMEEQAEEAVSATGTMRKQQSDEEVQVMRSLQDMLMRNPEVRAAFLARDRQALLALTSDLLAEERRRHTVSHLYFILPDRRVLLRTHDPAHAGDRIDRYVMLEAERTGKPAWGNEQGINGAFTLRVTAPWYIDGRLAGYIEMGAEVEDLFARIAGTMQGEALLLLNKHYFDEAQWAQSQRARGNLAAWREFRDVVVLSRYAPQIPQGVHDYLAGPRAPEGTQEPFAVNGLGRTTQVVEEPLTNSRGQKVGALLVMTDVSGLQHMWTAAIACVVLVFALIGGGLTFFFHRLLSRVQQDVATRSAHLNDAQARLLTEQAQRRQAQTELAAEQERNELLEARSRMVEELAAAKRTADQALQENEEITARLRATQSELLATARQAGRAEIATNVLHNVGNVLNSINTSASVIGATLRKSRLTGLTKALELLRAHGDDLGSFLSQDEKGRMLPGYLAGAAEALAAEHGEMAAELAGLVRSIEHVKDIVATQQSHASVSHVLEPVQPADLVEDALRIQGSSLARHQIRVVREFEAMPTVPLERGRILQILVNLITNAKNAMASTDPARQCLTLRIERPAPDRLRIAVQDTGEGIPPENLTRIFAHGFTTRRDGHGFGLHSSALAARELHGTLTAHSAGAGRGATFTLELPLGTLAAG